MQSTSSLCTFNSIIIYLLDQTITSHIRLDHTILKDIHPCSFLMISSQNISLLHQSFLYSKYITQVIYLCYFPIYPGQYELVFHNHRSELRQVLPHASLLSTLHFNSFYSPEYSVHLQFFSSTRLHLPTTVPSLLNFIPKHKNSSMTTNS